MDSLQQLTHFINKLVSDERMKPVHFSVSFALCHLWIENEFKQPYFVSRKLIMQASHVRSKATYHKVIRDLQKFGHLKYSPSYNPIKGSKVLIAVDNTL